MKIAEMIANNYPPEYNAFRGVRAWAEPSGLFSGIGEVNRFAARYRFAKSLQVALPGYSAGTAQGYDAIVRVALTWSAFESFLAAIGLSTKAKHIATVSAQHDMTKMLAEMRAAGDVLPFFKFVASELDTTAQKQTVEAFVKGNPCCALILAKSVRHIFFHGTLTPKAGQAESSAVAVACGLLAGGLVSVMDNEFSQRVGELVAFVQAL